MKRLSLLRLLVLFLLVAGAAAAGVIAAVATNRSLDAYEQALLRARPPVDISPQVPSPIPGTYEEALDRVQREAWPSVVAFTDVSIDTVSASVIFSEDAVRGYGMVVSTDGWVLTSQEALAQYAQPTVQAEAWNRGQRFALLEVVKDTRTNLVLVKIEADRLPVSAFGAAQAVQAGALTFAVTTRTILPTSVLDADRLTEVGAQDAEVFTTDWLLADDVVVPGPIVNGGGELVGMASGTASTPLHHGLDFIQDVLRGDVREYALLGVYVVELAHAWNLSTDISRGRQTGAVILAPSTAVRAVPTQGPAAQAGLEVRDIITAVDDVPIAAQVSLTELLDSYDAGDAVRLSILRNGEIATMTVTLGSSSDLVY